MTVSQLVALLSASLSAVPASPLDQDRERRTKWRSCLRNPKKDSPTSTPLLVGALFLSGSSRSSPLGASEALWSDAGVATDYRVAVLYYDTVRPLLAGIAGGGGGPGASPPVSPAAPARAPESVTESARGSGTTAGGTTSASPAASAALPPAAPAAARDAARDAVACDSAAFLRYLDRFSRFDASKLQAARYLSSKLSPEQILLDVAMNSHRRDLLPVNGGYCVDLRRASLVSKKKKHYFSRATWLPPKIFLWVPWGSRYEIP